jgi:hypothetical protein
MTQLISEQKIEEAAMKFDDSISWEGEQVRNGFNAGVDFALKEIEPLMIEFAKAEFAQQFIPVEEEMPPAQTKVLAKIDVGEGNIWTILAEHIEPRTVLAEDFFEDGDYEEEDMDYDEESDSYFVPDTWVECSYFGTSYIFSKPVIEWSPINKK